MMENSISISLLNDFIFCPLSIYFHSLDYCTESILYHKKAQIDGKSIHASIDKQYYSHKKDILQGISVYSEKYNLFGKIDVFDVKKKKLVERKKHIKQIYDGYIFQLYAEYYCLVEMGYQVDEIYLFSYDDNKMYKIDMPDENIYMKQKFDSLIDKISCFSIDTFTQTNSLKCQECVYEPLCFRSLLK